MIYEIVTSLERGLKYVVSITQVWNCVRRPTNYIQLLVIAECEMHLMKAKLLLTCTVNLLLR